MRDNTGLKQHSVQIYLHMNSMAHLYQIAKITYDILNNSQAHICNLINEICTVTSDG